MHLEKRLTSPLWRWVLTFYLLWRLFRNGRIINQASNDCVCNYVLRMLLQRSGSLLCLLIVEVGDDFHSAWIYHDFALVLLSTIHIVRGELVSKDLLLYRFLGLRLRSLNTILNISSFWEGSKLLGVDEHVRLWRRVLANGVQNVWLLVSDSAR